MRYRSIKLRSAQLLVSCATMAAGTPAWATEVDGPLPVRKAGHWKITTIAETLGMTSIDACIGRADSIAATTSPGSCSAPDVKHAGDQVIVTVTCTSAEGRETTSTLFTGDFTTWYRGIVKMTFDPPVQGRANLGVTLDAEYVGPDCQP